MFKRNQDPAAAFWKWFTKRRDLIDLDADQFLALVGDELTKHHGALAIEVGPPNQRPRDFIISADGMREHAAHVEALADAAPPLTDWRVVRFRPRLNDFAGFQLRSNDDCISADMLRFVAKRTGPLVDLDIYQQWRTEGDRRGADNATFMMLDMALGEFDVMFGLGQIDSLPWNEAPDHAKPWSEIREVYDSLSSGEVP